MRQLVLCVLGVLIAHSYAGSMMANDQAEGNAAQIGQLQQSMDEMRGWKSGSNILEFY